MKIPDAESAVDKEWKKLETSHAWNLEKVKGSKEVILDGQRDEKDSPLCFTDGHMSPQKNAELEPKLQKYKGRVALRGDFVKDDSGAYAVFAEQGSSACQITAAKIMDVVARLSGSDGQAADAVSGFTQVEQEDAPKLFVISKSEYSDIWIRLPLHKNHGTKIEDPVVLLYGHPLAGLLWERPFEKALFKNWIGANSELGMYVAFVRNKAYFCQKTWMYVE